MPVPAPADTARAGSVTRAGFYPRRVWLAIIAAVPGAAMGYALAGDDWRLGLFMAIAAFAIVGWSRTPLGAWIGLAAVFASAAASLAVKAAVLALPVAVCAPGVAGRTTGRRWVHGVTVSLVSIVAFAIAGALWPESLAPVVLWGVVTIGALMASHLVEPD